MPVRKKLSCVRNYSVSRISTTKGDINGIFTVKRATKQENGMKDKAKAIEWYQKSADLGYTYAAKALAELM